MSRPVITVDNLSKAYRIGLKEEVPDTLMSAMTGFLRAPLKRFNNLRRLNTFGHSDADDQDIYWALKDVSFEVQEGEVLGIIGRNGAGKSTLLKILSRITEPTRGRAVIRGRVSSLLEVGTGFHPELSGRENVYLNGTILGMTKWEIDRKFDEIVEFSGVEKFLDTPIKRYSSGMKVRLAFAVAAHLEPEILIIDEVLAVGDAEFQKKCMGKMQDVAQGGRTVIFVSHDLTAVQRLCTHAMLLSRGEKWFDGSTEDCLNTYLDTSVGVRKHELLGCPTNGGQSRFVDVTITDQTGLPIDFVQLMQPFRVRLQFQADHELRGLIIGIGIHTLQDFTLFATHTNDYGELTDLGAGTWEVIASIDPNCLREGNYYISAGAISRGETVAHVPRALELTVEPVVSQTGKHYDRRIGALFIPMKWTAPARV